MSVDLGRIKPGFQNSLLKEFGLALVKAGEPVMAAGRRAANKLFTALDESKRIQAARFISQHAHLIESKQSE
jgi:hypothetical protein